MGVKKKDINDFIRRCLIYGGYCPICGDFLITEESGYLKVTQRCINHNCDFTRDISNIFLDKKDKATNHSKKTGSIKISFDPEERLKRMIFSEALDSAPREEDPFPDVAIPPRQSKAYAYYMAGSRKPIRYYIEENEDPLKKAEKQYFSIFKELLLGDDDDV